MGHVLADTPSTAGRPIWTQDANGPPLEGNTERPLEQRPFEAPGLPCRRTLRRKTGDGIPAALSAEATKGAP